MATKKSTPAAASSSPGKRAHRATYARDKKKGGYIIRVQGPNAGSFAGREVPVTMLNGDEHKEKLTHLIWTGVDEETSQPVSLYGFESKPREKIQDDVSF